MRERWPAEMATWLADPAVPPPGGESFTEVSERVTAALHRVLADRQLQTVLIVSHVTPIKTLVAAALLAPLRALYRMHLDVAALCEIDWYPDGPAVLRSFNDTAHLGDPAWLRPASQAGSGEREPEVVRPKMESTGYGGLMRAEFQANDFLPAPDIGARHGRSHKLRTHERRRAADRSWRPAERGGVRARG